MNIIIIHATLAAFVGVVAMVWLAADKVNGFFEGDDND
jgi:hypothetical protein